jgi:superfamily II DNA or RNA helicase
MSPRRADPGFDSCRPHDAVIAMLWHRFAEPATGTTARGLAGFQQDALERVGAIIAARGGAVLADSVGLGKTHVAVALIRERTASGARVLVSGPAALAGHWRRHLRRVSGWRWLSHTSLSRGAAVPEPAAAPTLVVVDEAHAFRNPRTRRYAALAALCERADVLLLTATPVNNCLSDFYHLVRLFARDDEFADIGVPDLMNAAEHAYFGEAAALRTVARAVMVRRTRAFVQRHYDGTLRSADGTTLRFPRREPLRTLHYDLARCYPGLADTVEHAFGRLTFPVHANSSERPPAELLRLGLLKRLESSTAALRGSLLGHERMLSDFMAAARDGYLMDVATQRCFAPDVEGASQLPLPGVIMEKWPRHRDRDMFLQHAAEDLDALRAVRSCLEGAHAADDKLDVLRTLVTDEFADERILVFTEYRDTAVALWRELRAEGSVALIHGGGAWLGLGRAGRRTVIERFAPGCNGARLPPPHQRVRVLIATDVLAEGLNLQDARVVVSYDVPWNPVRIAQRLGRVDRLGSPHESVVAAVFMPDRGIDTLLGLMRRVRRKLFHIRLVGGDTPWSRGAPPNRLGARPAAPADERDSAEWERAELLRLEYRRSSSAAPPPDELDGAPIPAAAVSWHGPHAALVCFADDVTSWLVLCADRAKAVVDPADGDTILLDVLRGDAAAPADDDAPDAAWLAAAVRRARRALSQGWKSAPCAGDTRVTVRAARIVHRWLQQQSGFPSYADCRTADLVLAWLKTAHTVSTQLELAKVVNGRADHGRTVARLAEMAAAADDGRAARRRRVAWRPPRIVAVLELRPLPAGSASRGQQRDTEASEESDGSEDNILSSRPSSRRPPGHRR